MYELISDQYFIHILHGGGFFVKSGTRIKKTNIKFRGNDVKIIIDSDVFIMSIREFNQQFKKI